MKTLTRPENNIDEIIRDCTSNLRDKDVKSRLLSCIAFIEDCTSQFEDAMRAMSVHRLSTHDNVNGTVTKDEMVKLYTDKFSKQKQPGRKHYDKIMISVPNGQCPFCGIRPVSTIDHFMVKSLYPSLAISPINLVPACRDCNSTKGETKFCCAEEIHLHPYFDDISAQRWLNAELRNDINGYTVFYEIVKPVSCDAVLFKRVQNHFKLFGIQKLYCLQAIDEIAGVEYKLRKIKSNAGLSALLEDVNDTVESCEKISLNSWKSALYRGIANSPWFLETYL